MLTSSSAAQRFFPWYRQIQEVLVFAKDQKEEDAKAAGADYVGGKELADKIAQGWMDFDVVVATPDMMAVIGRLGRVLGPKGLI